MRLSRKSDYALRAVRYCSCLPKGAFGSIRNIAEAEAVPREFLAKILKDLTSGGILVSFRGVTGGYAVTREPKDISFLDVIEAVNGPLQLNLCTEPGGCRPDQRGGCYMCDFWKAQEKTLKKVLSRQHFGKYAKGRR